MNDKDELLKILQNLSGNSSPDQQNVSVGKIMAQLQHITGYLKHLEQGIVNMAAEVQRCSLLEQLFVNLFVEKGLITKEEFQEMYTNQVFLPMKRSNEAFQEKIKQVAEKQQVATQPSPVIVAPETKEEEEDASSTVILASERFKKQ